MMRNIMIVAGLALAIHVAGAAGQKAADVPAARCSAALAHEKVRGVLPLMGRLPDHRAGLWNDYRAAEATYLFVVRVGEMQSCGIVWRGRGAEAPFALAEEPRRETPLYAFFVPQSARRARTLDETTQPGGGGVPGRQSVRNVAAPALDAAE